jgi:hypothetical protein
MMDEKKFKRGKFVSYHIKKKAGKFEVSEIKLALSNPKCLDWYDMDEDCNDSLCFSVRR